MKKAYILKLAFIFPMVIYGFIAVRLAGPPRWGAALVPAGSDSAITVLVISILALGDWALGISLGRMRKPPAALAQLSQGPGPWPMTRFFISAALLESGAILGLILSTIQKDSRYAIVSAGIAALLLFLTQAEGVREDVSITDEPYNGGENSGRSGCNSDKAGVK